MSVQCTEASESICGEKDFFAFLISNHDFWPVYHRCEIKTQRMGTKGNRIIFLYGDGLAIQICVIKLFGKCQSFGIPHNFQIREPQQKFFDIGTVVRLHVIDDQIVQRTSVQDIVNIFQELMGNRGIHCVDQCCFFICDQVGVVRNTPRYGKQVFKKCQSAVIAAYPAYCVIQFSRAVHK